MTVTEVIDTLQTWIRNADDEYDREEMGRVAGLKEALHEIKKIEPCGKDINAPATDAISRQAAKNAICDYVCGKGVRCVENHVCRMKKLVSDLPPVQPKQNTGHWIPSNIPESILDECSECGFSCGAFTFNYCPNCGAKMIEPQESEVEE